MRLPAELKATGETVSLASFSTIEQALTNASRGC